MVKLLVSKVLERVLNWFGLTQVKGLVLYEGPTFTVRYKLKYGSHSDKRRHSYPSLRKQRALAAWHKNELEILEKNAKIALKTYEEYVNEHQAKILHYKTHKLISFNN